jgi:hypothetical protein
VLPGRGAGQPGRWSRATRSSSALRARRPARERPEEMYRA